MAMNGQENHHSNSTTTTYVKTATQQQYRHRENRPSSERIYILDKYECRYGKHCKELPDVSQISADGAKGKTNLPLNTRPTIVSNRSKFVPS